MQYEHLLYTPAFYFLIAFTITLTLGYTWGRRWNRRVVVNALDPLLSIFNARDQQFTNIGGQTGFHANIVPGNMRSVRRIDVTLTILPRQSWLYMPFSLLVRKFDRMQTIFFFTKHGKAIREEVHLIEKRFATMMGNSIENADSFTREEIEWGTRRFYVYSSSAKSRKWVQHLIDRFGEPGTLRHAALIPREERAYLFLIPKVGTVPPQITQFRDWIEETAHAAGLKATDEHEDADTASPDGAH